MSNDWLALPGEDPAAEENETRHLAWLVFVLFIAGVIIAGWEIVSSIFGW